MLKRRYRLRERQNFGRLYRQGRSAKSAALTFYSLPNRLGYNRLGVVVSTKVSKKAVVRNRLRRYLQGMVEARWAQLPIGHDYLISARPEAAKTARGELKNQLINCLGKLNLDKPG